MRKITLTLVCAVLFLVSMQAQAQKNFLDVNYIEVNGTAEMEVLPDLIYLRIFINEKDLKNRVPILEQEKAMLEKLSKIGIDTKKDLSMEDIDSNFRRRKFVSNDVLLSKSYTLLVHDGATASKVYTELEDIDISNISVARIDHSKITDLRKEVRANAVKAAKEKADYLTKAVEQTAGRALYIEEINQGYAQPMYANTMMRKGSLDESAGGYESQIDFKKIKIEFTMLVRFELK